MRNVSGMSVILSSNEVEVVLCLNLGWYDVESVTVRLLNIGYENYGNTRA
jgi:hypothetical protein